MKQKNPLPPKLRWIKPRPMNKLKTFTLASVLVATTAAAYAFTRPGDDGHKVKVKIIKIVDGDTTITEKTVDESELSNIDKDVKDVKGKNVKVMMYVNDEKNEKQGKDDKITMNKTFAFDFDSLSKICKIELNIDSLMNAINQGFDFTVITDNDKNAKHGEKKVIIKKSGSNSSSYSYSFDTDSLDADVKIMNDGDGEKNSTIIITSPGDKDGKKVIVRSSVIVIDDNNKPHEKKKIRKEEESDNDLRFYPNPSDGKFTIEYDIKDKAPAMISITDMNGKILFKDEVKGGGKYTKQLDLGNNGKGTFILNLQQGKRSISKKIVIQ
jgi:hypothetical protein